MVTVYIEGPSLQEAVGLDGPLPSGEVRALGAGLAEGLAAIHACGLVHRDLKPGNVVMAADGPRIIDFGIARAVDASTGITTTGAVVGTVAYMSPEQLRGEMAGQASDVFSLGGVLAFAATGRPPFGSDSAVSIMFRMVSQPPDLTGVADGKLRELIAACLAKPPGTGRRPGPSWPRSAARYRRRSRLARPPAQDRPPSIGARRRKPRRRGRQQQGQVAKRPPLMVLAVQVLRELERCGARPLLPVWLGADRVTDLIAGRAAGLAARY